MISVDGELFETVANSNESFEVYQNVLYTKRNSIDTNKNIVIVFLRHMNVFPSVFVKQAGIVSVHTYIHTYIY